MNARTWPLGILVLSVACSTPPVVVEFDTSQSDAGHPVLDAGIDAATGIDAVIGSDAGMDAAIDSAIDAASNIDSGAADGGHDAATLTDAAAPIPEHLLFSEISVVPAGGEFFEIWNPTATAVALDHYFVSDNAAYYGIAAGTAWAPVGTTGTDFLAQFPPGAMIAPNAVIVVATSPMFVASFSRCPDYILATTALTCTGGGTAAAMIAPTNGGFDSTHAGSQLTNDREMLVLFEWQGPDAALHDVDYVTWGADFDAATRADKTGITGYHPDTAAASQHPAVASGMGTSMTRCTGEALETASGGNGITGHDETSEHLDVAFELVESSPGTHNPCP